MYFFIFSISCMADNKIDKKYQKIISDIKEFEKKGKFIGYFDDSCNRIDDKGKAEYYRILHSENNGVYLITQHFMNGKINSIYQSRSMDDCELEENSEKTKREGKMISFLVNGKKYREINYKNGKLNGKEYWYGENGNIERISEYKNNVKDGKEIFYFKNSKISSETMYKNGEVEGKWADYNKDGSIRDQGEVINGNGKYRTYFENGKLHSETIYKNGKRKYVEYYENGKIKGSLTFHENGDTSGEGENVYYTE